MKQAAVSHYGICDGADILFVDHAAASSYVVWIECVLADTDALAEKCSTVIGDFDLSTTASPGASVYSRLRAS